MSKNEKALRYNSGKPEYSLLAMDCLEPCVRVLEYGAKKYARNNWRKGMPQTEILDSLMRHVSALLRGEMVDEESGLSHIGHIQCNAMFLANPNNVQDLENMPGQEVEFEPLTPEDVKEMWGTWPHDPKSGGYNKLHCKLHDEEKEVD